MGRRTCSTRPVVPALGSAIARSCSALRGAAVRGALPCTRSSVRGWVSGLKSPGCCGVAGITASAVPEVLAVELSALGRREEGFW